MQKYKMIFLIGYHRYVFVAYEQERKINFSEEPRLTNRYSYFLIILQYNNNNIQYNRYNYYCN